MKKVLSVLMVAVVLLTLVPMSIEASALNATGQCGDNVYWTFDADTGEVVISGTGAIKFKYESPFSYNNSIKSIVINEGVTSISGGAFVECPNLTEVHLPDSLTVIGDGAFWGDDGISYIEIPDNVTTLGSDCFSFCSKLERVIIPGSVTKIGDGIFDFCSLEEIIYNGTEREWENISIGINNHLLLNNVKYGFCNNHINTTDYPIQPPTCVETGYTEGTYCNDCGYWISGHLFIKPLRHTDVENDGICDVCKGTSSDIIIGQETVIVGNGEKDVLRLIPEESGTFIIDTGSYLNEVYIYDIETGRYVCDYDNWLEDIELEAGKIYTVTASFDEGYYVRGNILISPVEEITEPSTSDKITDGDIPTTEPEEPTTSNKEEQTTEPENTDDNSCSHLCHKSGFGGFIWKIVRFFWKLFKINPVCSCGIAHY